MVNGGAATLSSSPKMAFLIREKMLMSHSPAPDAHF
jgi:hypothetical protein